MSQNQNINIGMIGAGKMGQAILEGLISRKFSARRITASDPSAAQRKRLKQKLKINTTADNTQSAGCEIIMLAVKPQMLDAVLQEVRPVISPHALVISIAAGRSLRSLRTFLPKNPIARVMPNLPATAGQGFSALTFNRKCRPEHKALVTALFESVGATGVFPEKRFDAVTAISGSGPAYVFYLAQIWQEAAIELGFTKAQARRLVYETLKGSVALLEASDLPAAQLMNNVASKGGTTEAALKVLKQRGFDAHLIDAIKAAAKRSEELSCQS